MLRISALPASVLRSARAFSVLHSPLQIDLPKDVNFTDFVTKDFHARGDKVAILDSTGSSRTFAELVTDVNAVACNLRDIFGFGGKEKAKSGLMVVSPNHVDYFTAVHGSLKAGGFVTPANPLYTPDELASQLTGSGSQLIATHSLFKDKVLEAVDLHNEHVNKTGNGVYFDPETQVLVFDHCFDALKDWPDGDYEQSFTNDVDLADDIALLPYSSGTTGLPKGTMLTHHNLIANLLQFEAPEAAFWAKGPGNSGSSEVLISPLPFFHIYGAIASLNLTLLHGAKLVTMPAFDLEKFLSMVQEEQCTRAHLVPPIILGLAKHPIVDNYDLSSLKCVISAAAPLGEDTEAACQARLGQDVILKQGYGMSELSPVASLVPDDGLRPGTGTVGPPVANMSFKIIDLETGEVLPHGEEHEGELCCKGPNVMKGYLNNDLATEECLDDEGWLRTGDIGYLTSDGYLMITDRLKELIKFKGFQVAPAELEDVLLSHDSIIDACVIPRLDDEAGELPLAFVVVSPQAVMQPTEAEIQAFVAAKVAPHKQLRGGVEFIDAVPKSPTGKLLRRMLVERERAGEFSAHA